MEGEKKFALISVSDKTGIVELGKELESRGYTILSTGGTAKALRAGLNEKSVLEVSEYTGFPESPDGLVKTLQPLIHGGFLLDENTELHLEYMRKNNISPIDFVAVNLYPFEATVEKKIGLIETLEQIDIGGPAMVRSAAKGMLLHGRPLIVVDPQQYSLALGLLDQLHTNKNYKEDTLKDRIILATVAYARTHSFDRAIVDYLMQQPGKLHGGK